MHKHDVLTLHVARMIADELIAYLRKGSAFARVEPCGELRRLKDVLTVIDLIAVADDEAAAADDFLGWQGFSDVVSREARAVTAKTPEGVAVVLRFADAATFGGALFRHTGCDEFTSLFVGHEHAAEEADVFAAAGLPFIPPELREGRDEIAFVRSPRFSSLITRASVKADLHVHSTYSDGQNSIPLIAERARKMGYAYIGIADHSMSLDAAKGISPKKFYEKKAAIDKINREYRGFTVLCGTEVDIMPDGRLDYPQDVLAAADYVIGSVHIETRMEATSMTPRIIRAIESGKIDILGHPTGRIFGVRDSLAIDFDPIARACAAYGVAMEISGYPNRFDLNDTNILKAKSYGAIFSTNTDAHFIDHLDNIDFSVYNARRALLTTDDVINTKDLAAFRQWIATRRKTHGKA